MHHPDTFMTYRGTDLLASLIFLHSINNNDNNNNNWCLFNKKERHGNQNAEELSFYIKKIQYIHDAILKLNKLNK